MVDATTRQFEQRVLAPLRALGRRLRWYVVLDGLPIVLATTICFLVATFLVDRSLWLARDMRAVQLLSLILVVAAATWRWIVRPLTVPLPCSDLALLLERRFPQLHSRLITAVELAHAPAAGRSPALVQAVIQQAQRDAAALPFGEVLRHDRARRRGAITLLCLALFAAAGIAGGSTAAMWFQRNILLKDVEWPLRNRLTVEGLTDGKLLVPRGDDLTVSAVVDEGFEAPRQVHIEYTGRDGLRGRDQMPALESESAGEPARRFTHTFERLGETLQCRISGGDARTEPFTIEVVERPRVAEIVIGVDPPPYTRSEAYELRAGQTVAEVLKGSRIRLRVRTNKPLRRANLVRAAAGEENEVSSIERLGALLYAAADVPEANGTYYFRMEDELGLGNISERTPPVRVSVRLVPDQPPKVKLRARGVGEMITPQAVLPLETDFSDRYGLASARLVYETGRKDSAPVPEPLSGLEAGTRTYSHSLDWPAAAHGLVEGDRLTLRAEATDFDDVSGPNVGQSPPLALRVVSREELAAELNRREQEYRQDFERLLRQQEELYGDLLSLSADRKVSGDQRARRIGQLTRLQRDLAGRCNSLRMHFEQVLSELRVNQLATPMAESRLGGGIIEPLAALVYTRLPAAADAMDRLARDAERLAEARSAQEAVLADMKRILANMLKWEGFQEAVGLLREVLKMQNKVAQETEARIEAEVLGVPATVPDGAP